MGEGSRFRVTANFRRALRGRSPRRRDGYDKRSAAMTYYVGVLDGGGEVWGVRIPDIPGCVGGGKTPEAAIADAARRPPRCSRPQARRRFRRATAIEPVRNRGVRGNRRGRKCGHGPAPARTPAERCAPTSALTQPCSTRLTPPPKSAASAARRSSPARRARRSWLGHSELVEGSFSVRVAVPCLQGVRGPVVSEQQNRRSADGCAWSNTTHAW